MDYDTARALLEWQVELGATEAIGDAPVNRYEAPATLPKAKKAAPAVVAAPKAIDPADEARKVSSNIPSIAALHEAMQNFEHCELRSAAQNMIFAEGTENADVMIIADAPSRDDDRAGKLFTGPSGELIDKMFAAIGLKRADDTYITPITPWCPPAERDLSQEEIDMMRPFVLRHIELVAPKVVILLGNGACRAFVGDQGLRRLHGQWVKAGDVAAIPIYPPHQLLRAAQFKRDAWMALLAVQSALRT